MIVQSPSKRTPLQVPQWGPCGESCPFPEPSCLYHLDSQTRSPDKTESHLSLRVPGNGMVPPFSLQWGPCGERHQFPEPTFTYPSGSPVKEPSLQVPHPELP
jgi:hypothetical protein